MRRERPHPLTHGASRYFVGRSRLVGARELRLWFWAATQNFEFVNRPQEEEDTGNRQKTTGKCQPPALPTSEQPSALLDDYARFVDCTPDYVANSHCARQRL